MNILTINTEAQGGGASRIAFSLFEHYLQEGHTSSMYTGIRDHDDPKIEVVNNDQRRNFSYQLFDWLLRFSLRKRIPIVPRVFSILKAYSEPMRMFFIRSGREDFCFPATRDLPHSCSIDPDLIHAHNLFGNFFDLRQLPRISNALPVIWTLHDMWAFTGHCSYAKGCNRWQQGCGKCPDLTLPPSIAADATSDNLKAKAAIYGNSKIYIATPSKWLMNLANESILAPAIKESRVIHNGVEQDVFRPGDRDVVREQLNIPASTITLLYAASGAQSNPYKDYETIKAAFPIIIERNPGKEFLFLCVGERNPVPDKSGLPIRVLPWVSNRADLAKYYQAADLFLHAANMENFPTTILEALSCGLPCVATDVGGISEQVESGVNGCLVKPNDPEEMAEGVQRVLNCPQGIAQMSRDAAGSARGLYSRERMGNDYLNWFAEILEAA